ncbi:hypothetical protein [Rhodoblastus sp.]|uniref:hypothetical protein n=1 Tax=Rhodoblastus sp. TaxID=1962975 RepID=UPI003F9442BF
MLRALALWLSGHSPSVLHDEGHEATHSISLTGGLVGVATAVTAANWGVAGSVFTGGSAAWIGGAVGAIAGATFALSVDRPGAFALDAQAPGRGRKLAILGARVGACLLVSAVTTEAVMPLVLGQDGARIALEQRETRDAARSKDLAAQFDVVGLRASVTQADAVAAAAQSAAAMIPPAILRMEGHTKACSQALARRRNALVAKGVNEVERRRQLGPISARCNGLANAARRELERYRETSQKALSEAVAAQSTAHTALEEAEKAIKERLSEAREIEKNAITPLSSIVGDSVLNASPAARRKWIGTYLLLLLLELSPLGFKWLGGPSGPGSRMAVDHELAVARHIRRRDDAIHADEQRLAVRDSVDEMFDAALKSQVVRDRLRQTFEAGIEPLVAFDIYRRVIAEMEEMHELRRDAARRCPDASDAINGLADAVIEDLVARLRERTMTWRQTAANAA